MFLGSGWGAGEKLVKAREANPHTARLTVERFLGLLAIELEHQRRQGR